MPQNVGNDQSLNFQPASVTVAPGTAVTFSDQDSQSGAPHDVVWTSVPSGASPANSPVVMTSGQTFTVTLTTPGTYSYDCEFHSAWMHATITVS
jgi:plastocyanin